MSDPLHLSCLGVLKDQEEIAVHLLDRGDSGAHKVDAQLLGPDIEFFVTLTAGPDVDIVDGDIGIGIFLLHQLGIF
ncbi:MAG: hypothetical protein A4E49_02222 [Methanosaeta sp. PtaU1.Bin112]|nr:MAG: hypothetical protein A4E49_02222 [Methanosaeta sp. PtaU1.Bin112]